MSARDEQEPVARDPRWKLTEADIVEILGMSPDLMWDGRQDEDAIRRIGNAFLQVRDRLEGRFLAPPAAPATAIDVVAAVRRDMGGRVWLGKRNADGAHAGLRGLWEYPGGKVEADEQLRDALLRELEEEFPGVAVEIGRVLDSIDATYGNKVYRVTFFEVAMFEEPKVHPCHSEVRWMTPAEACAVPHLPSGTIFNARHLAPATAEVERIETGRHQHGDDWPGVFIRGDNAFAFGLALDLAIGELGDDRFELVALYDLRKLLQSCTVIHATPEGEKPE